MSYPRLVLLAVAVLGLASMAVPAFAVPVTIDVGAAAGADAIFVHWMNVDPAMADPDSMRLAVTAEPFAPGFDGGLGVVLGDARVLPMEATISKNVSGDKVELTRFKAAIFRATIAQLFPAEVLTVYRDLDRGIEWGGDLLGLRIPIRVTPEGAITLSPGMELGVRHYTDGTTGVHASAVLDARAVTTLIQGWLDAGVLARVRYDAVSGGRSGDEEMASGFLSLALDSKNRFFARVYGGIERDGARADLGLPTVNTFLGAGLFGNFKGN
ncbi:MAG: hypothetical protein HY075_06335 [Deltaproteobacteria bacterium]|nr:hypothetical protein [Deltaproteobacteria bacterium]